MENWIEKAASYPRPDRVRESYIVLDGEWDFSFDYLNRGMLSGWNRNPSFSERIKVPFCVESELSGVRAPAPPNVFWYGKRFDCPEEFQRGRRVFLNFGAVDYAAKVWLNGRLLGEHTGGYTPFGFDVTGQIKPGENLLVVRVREHLDPRIPRGKQSPIGAAVGIVYTPVSGMWQSVWLESVGAAHTHGLAINSDLATGGVELTIEVRGDAGNYRLELTATGPDGDSHLMTSDFIITTRGDTTLIERMTIKSPKTWAPGNPNLYRLNAKISSTGGDAQDSLSTYFGFRTIEVKDGQILFNGKRFYQKLLLTQGYFPGGHYTPADWELFRADVRQALEMGFNGVRMHQKIENPKFLFWCDALGLLVWEEMPSAWLWSKTMRNALTSQWTEAIIRDRNHPCIVAWTPFNESWGVNNLVYSERVRKFVKEIVAMTKKLDPTRPVIDNSGFEHVEPEILDLHHYLGTVEQCKEYYAKLRDPRNMEFNFMNVVARLQVDKNPVSALAPGVKYKGQPLFISEYGGFGFYKNEGGKGLLENVRDYTLAIAEDEQFWGYAYTQQYDTEKEKNGLLTFDRQPKIPLEDLQALSREVDEIVGKRWGNK